jgi:uracil-DNA glycosylase
MTASSPGRDCPLCPRLVAFRKENRQRCPGWHNAPVPSFGAPDSWLLVVGLAPGLKGANRTGRPFTGDHAGVLLYATLQQFGLARGAYEASAQDGLELVGCRITNAVRCVPPNNKPAAAEVAQCGGYLAAELAALPNLKAVIALGTIAHGAILTALALKKSPLSFRHGAIHRLPGEIVLADSYHCSRLNTATGRLTPAMFHSVFEDVMAACTRRDCRPVGTHDGE